MGKENGQVKGEWEKGTMMKERGEKETGEKDTKALGKEGRKNIERERRSKMGRKDVLEDAVELPGGRS